MNAEIHAGFAPGLLGWTVREHGLYYAEHWGFGPFFEAKVAREMSDFVGRLGDAGNHLFWAGDGEGPVASVSLDRGDAQDGLVHLRWFIASDRARGQGLGSRLITQCLDAARDDGARGVYLTTFAGLDAARRIYDAGGFRLVLEADDTTWGTRVREQRFEKEF